MILHTKFHHQSVDLFSSSEVGYNYIHALWDSQVGVQGDHELRAGAGNALIITHSVSAPEILINHSSVHLAQSTHSILYVNGRTSLKFQ